MSNFLEHYLPHGVEYGDPTEVNVGEYGWRIDYISQTFLVGWINYVHVIKAYAVTRYTEDGTLEAKVKAFNAERCHIRLGDLGDDVVILAKDGGRGGGDGPGYWLFEFDQDVSDCTIGRFRTDDTAEVVLARFNEYASSEEAGGGRGGPSYELRASRFKEGWVSW